MADTMRGDMPDTFCSDCGQKGCYIKHWGPLVPPGQVGFFDECWQERMDDSDAGKEPRVLAYDSKTGEKLYD